MKNPLQFREIIRLADMLAGAGVPFTLHRYLDGWQLIYPVKDAKPVSVIQHSYSYGGPHDKLELEGLMTKAEKKADAIMGFMSAEEVFNRISKHWRLATDEQKDPSAL